MRKAQLELGPPSKGLAPRILFIGIRCAESVLFRINAYSLCTAVEAIAFKNGWDWVDCENEIVAFTCPCTPCSNAKASSHWWVWAKSLS